MVDPKIDSGQYLLKEAEFLRTSYSDYAKEIGALERYALLSTGAIWSWVAANPASTFAPLLAWIPLILQTLFGLRA